ncbi:MAG: adenylate kinase [Chloroflexi bacterium]|nr:MAG: adenylate kinase [Chloroflexota bacterium]
MSDVVLLGAPGSGKGTQASRIASERRWVHLSTGDLFRMHLVNDTALGQLAKSYMDNGELVPDEITVDMVRDRLERVPTDARVIYDGFPRTVRQAEALDELLTDLGRSFARAVLLDVPRDELVRRMTKRATCMNCQTVYNLATNPPKREGVCDRCGGQVLQRSDESPQIIERRLDVYEKQTKPLIELYAKRGGLRRIDGTGDPLEVAKRMSEAFA